MKDNRPKLIMLVGVPASGKSTWVQGKSHDKLISAKEFEMASIHSTDQIIEDIGFQYGMTYNEAFDCIKFAEKVFFHRLQKSAAIGHDIIVDRTNLSVKSRKRILDIVDQVGDYKKIAVVFDTPNSEEHDRRLASRAGKTIPRHVIDSMKTSMTPPTKEEGFDEIVTGHF